MRGDQDEREKKHQEEGIQYPETRRMSRAAPQDEGIVAVEIKDHHLLRIPEEIRGVAVTTVMTVLLIVKGQTGSRRKLSAERPAEGKSHLSKP